MPRAAQLDPEKKTTRATRDRHVLRSFPEVVFVEKYWKNKQIQPKPCRFGYESTKTHCSLKWNLVPLIDGRYHIITQLAVYIHWTVTRILETSIILDMLIFGDWAQKYHARCRGCRLHKHVCPKHQCFKCFVESDFLCYNSMYVQNKFLFKQKLNN